MFKMCFDYVPSGHHRVGKCPLSVGSYIHITVSTLVGCVFFPGLGIRHLLTISENA